MNEIKIKALSSISFEIIKVEQKKEKFTNNYDIKIKLLIKNVSNLAFSKVYFDIKFYDDNNNLIDCDKKWVYDINPKSETIGILSTNTDTKISYCNVSLADIRFKDFRLEMQL